MLNIIQFKALCKSFYYNVTTQKQTKKPQYIVSVLRLQNINPLIPYSYLNNA